MTEYTIGTGRKGGKTWRYLRIKSDAEIALTGDLVTFTKAQEDKVSVYEVIVGDLLREASEGGFFYRWYKIESALVETDHTPQLAAEVEGMAPTAAAASIVFVALAEAGQIDTVTAEEHVELFAPWVYPADYKTGNLRRHNGRLYKCIVDHTSQADWAPDVAVSLWVPTSDPAEEWLAWSQPVGAHDAYNTGDKVSHNGKHWTSNVDSNVWEPGVYGWTEMTE